MNKESKLIEGAKRILAAFDKAIVGNPWDSSILVRATGKKLRALRYRLNTAIKTALGEDQVAVQVAKATGPSIEQQAVYISLYNADGESLPKWQSLIRALVAHAVSRPIYDNEADIEAAIRAKANPKTEGYVIVYVNKSDIKPQAAGFILKDNAIKLNNINQFVHQSGRYRFENGYLERQ